jgi:hypothetical protein
VKLKLLVTVLAVAALFALPATASASYYMSKAQAQTNMRGYARDHYGSQSVSAFCRPQGVGSYDPHYDYHRWVCGWADSAGCEGRVLIIGARGPYFYAKVMRGQRCPY